MDKKKQKMISVTIGLILALLLVVIGVRVIQRRASKASQPESLNAKRVSETQCEVTATVGTDEPILLRFGVGETPAFFHRVEESGISALDDGKFQQQAMVDNLTGDRTTFMVEGFEDTKAYCEAYSDSAGSEDTTAGTGVEEIVQDTTNVEPEVPEPTDTPEPTEEPSEEAVIAKSPLTEAMANEYFEDEAAAGNTVDVTDCWDHFQDDYISYVHPCAVAWKAQ